MQIGNNIRNTFLDQIVHVEKIAGNKDGNDVFQINIKLMWIIQLRLILLIDLMNVFLLKLHMSCYKPIGTQFDIVCLYKLLLVHILDKPFEDLNVTMHRYINVLNVGFII